MTLIRCSDNCIYQKEGYCTREEDKEKYEISRLSMINNCLYYIEAQSGEIIHYEH